MVVLITQNRSDSVPPTLIFCSKPTIIQYSPLTVDLPPVIGRRRDISDFVAALLCITLLLRRHVYFLMGIGVRESLAPGTHQARLKAGYMLNQLRSSIYCQT